MGYASIEEALAARCTHTCRERPNLRIHPSHCAARKGCAIHVAKFQTESACADYSECTECPGPVPINPNAAPVGEIIPVKPDWRKHWQRQKDAREVKKRQRNPTIDGKRRCSKCKQMVPVDQFYQKATGHYESMCKPCTTEYMREQSKRRKEQRRELRAQRLAEIKAMKEKRCTCCGKVLPIERFTWNQSNWKSWCKTCSSGASTAARRARKALEKCAGQSPVGSQKEVNNTGNRICAPLAEKESNGQ